jgi:hypothetical protein
MLEAPCSRNLLLQSAMTNSLFVGARVGHIMIDHRSAFSYLKSKFRKRNPVQFTKKQKQTSNRMDPFLRSLLKIEDPCPKEIIEF